MTKNRRTLPSTASVAIPKANGKLHAPSAARNRDAITEAIRRFMPSRGQALEIASGTGEHVVRYAAAFPAVTWQPTDVEAERLESIAAWSLETGLPNILVPQILDATLEGWAVRHKGQNLIILSNLLHLISEPEALTLISQSAKALAPGGVFLIYGPFLRDTEFASESDRSFDESLRGKDPDIGYKSFASVQSTLVRAGLSTPEPIEMPSNNLILAGRKA